MIVQSNAENLHLVKQWEHGKLAAQLGREFGGDDFLAPDPFKAVVKATADHDIGWREPDSKPLFNSDTARPLNFLDINWDQHAEFYREGVETVVQDHVLAGLLVSMHWIGLYRRRWGTQPELDIIPNDRQDKFNEIVREEQKRWINLKQQLWDPPEEPRRSFEDRLWHNYEWLQFWDRFSIFICSKSLHTDATQYLYPVPHRNGPEEVKLRVTSPGTVESFPYPFRKSPFQVNFQTTVIPDRDYASARDLRQTFDKTEPSQTNCKIKRP